MLIVSGILAACSGGVSSTNTSSSVTAHQYTVGGTVSGLSGTGLTLQNNGGDTLAVSANGAFAFPTPLISGDSYSVVVASQPNLPTQTCVANANNGTVADSNVASVVITCASQSNSAGNVEMDTIGGTAVGILGSGLVLQDDSGDNLSVSASGSFTFKTPLAQGQQYAATVLTPPINPYQDCAISGGSGTTGTSNITNVQVSCTTNSSPAFTIGGTVSGVSSAGAVVLQDNGRDNLTISADGPFTFPIAIPSGSSYSVTSASIGGQQSQTCRFANASGTVASSNVTNVTVTCQANAPVSVTVSGLLGSGLVLQDNDSDNLAVSGNGTATFATALPSGSPYQITVATPPQNPTQNCAVVNGSGIVKAGTTTKISVSCTTDSFSLGGTVAGVSGTLTLQVNGTNSLTVTANGPFTFPSALPSGTAYMVSAQPQSGLPSQTCTVANAAGIVGATNISDIAVTCAINSFPVGGTVTGLTNLTSGVTVAGLSLQDNAGTPLPITAAGFTFPGTTLSGGPYAVTIATEPSGYACAVSNGSGNVTNAAITNISVSCSLIGAFLYVTNGGGGSISGFAIDANTGILQPLTQVVATSPAANAIVATTGNNPSSIVAGCGISDTEPLYVANADASSISTFSANLNTEFVDGVGPGAVTLIAATTPATNPTSTLPVGSPSFLDFNQSLCEVVALGTYQGAPASPVAQEVLPNVAQFGANPQTAALTAPGTEVMAESKPVAAAHAYLGRRETFVEYIADQVTGDINEFDYFEGFLTLDDAQGGPVSDGTAAKPAALAVTPYGGYDYVYVADYGTNGISEYFADPENGYHLSPIPVSANGLPVRATTGNGPFALAQAKVTTNAEGDLVTTTYVYVANRNDGTVSAFSVSSGNANYLTGQLVPVAPMTPIPTGQPATGQLPVAMTVVTFTNADSTTTSYLYVVNSGSNSVAAFSIASNTGALSALAPSSFAVGSMPTAVAAAPVLYAVGGTILNVTGAGLVLQDNDGDNLSVPPGSTAFTFATPLASGTTYAVSVQSQPAGQTCTVTNGTGTVGTGNVNSASISCVNNPYTVGGRITNVLGDGLVLQNNGGDNLNVPSDSTAFTFATPLTSGTTYDVTVQTPPTNEICTVTNGTGTVTTANVTTVSIACGFPPPQ